MTAVADHPAKLVQGEDEDYVEYLGRQGDAWCDNPPPAPPGFVLVECGATPRHWPEYQIADSDFYDAPCSHCQYQALQKSHDPCRHSHHWPWRRWRITSEVHGWLYSLGVVVGGGWTFDGYCRGCLNGVRFRGKRSYILGKRREWWACLRRGHVRGEHVGFGLCGKCMPCPDCGSTTAGHRLGCEL